MTRQRPTFRVKPHDYQPNEAELEGSFHATTTPENLARAVLAQVHVVEDPEA